MKLISYLDQLDKTLFLHLNNLHCPLMDAIMWQISQNQKLWIPLYLVIIYFIFKARKWKAGIITLLFLVLMVVISDQGSVFIKNMVLRPRPSHNPEFTGIIHLINEYQGGMYGFVSSHAANTFALAIFTSLFFNKKWVTTSILLWAVVVSYSRIYLGVHYPFDVLGGALVGLISGTIIFFGERKFYRVFIKKNDS
jgi:undecaprenyl-diphosphatase